MANHQEWIDLTIIEKMELVGKMTHLLQNDQSSFRAFIKWIELSDKIGLFNDVKFNNERNS